MRKVKIVCTLGPACDDIEKLRELVKAGLNVARFNFSHGDYEGHGRMLEMVRRVEKENDFPIAAMLDTKGPEIRTGLLEDHKQLELKAGALFKLYTGEREGNADGVSISYARLPEEVETGRDLFIDDGSIHLKIEKIDEGELTCRVLTGGILGERKGVNVPGASLSVPTLTDKDIDDIKWGIDHEMDYIAVSFVRSREDIMLVRKVVEDFGGFKKRISLIAKIETLQSVQNLEEIVQVVDAVMVARGDLGVELPTEIVPIIQKRIIELCRNRGKAVIVATQMLDSMIRNPRPTRAEASDVANAVLDGADAVMLSGETANGKYPAESVKTMENIVLSTEKELLGRYSLDKETGTAVSVTDSVSHAAMRIAEEMNISSVISLTRSGNTARMISRYRPKAAILAATPFRSTWRSLALTWGVRPLLIDEYENAENAVDAAMESLVMNNLVMEGEKVVITTGFPVSASGTTNMLLVQTVGMVLFNSPSLIKKEASGSVRIALTAAEARDKVQNGDILVTRSACADYLPAMKKAAAFITEEIGMANFTAMTALQLGIPCITGALGAMEKLEDGMIITVDGVHGVVYEGRMRII